MRAFSVFGRVALHLPLAVGCYYLGSIFSRSFIRIQFSRFFDKCMSSHVHKGQSLLLLDFGFQGGLLLVDSWEMKSLHADFFSLCF